MSELPSIPGGGGGGGPFSKFLGWFKQFFVGFGNWIWSLVPGGIKQKFNIKEAGLWGMIAPIFSLFKNIYFLMVIPSIIVVYKLYEVLKDKGIITKFQSIVVGVLDMVIYIANDCFPLILQIKELGDCVADAQLNLDGPASPDVLLPASFILNLVT